MPEQELTKEGEALVEKWAAELFWEDWDREHTRGLFDSGDWDECPNEWKDRYREFARELILSEPGLCLKDMSGNYVEIKRLVAQKMPTIDELKKQFGKESK
jgi:hypothetical protein